LCITANLTADWQLWVTFAVFGSFAGMAVRARYTPNSDVKRRASDKHRLVT
jgi:hypothetical protein